MRAILMGGVLLAGVACSSRDSAADSSAARDSAARDTSTVAVPAGTTAAGTTTASVRPASGAPAPVSEPARTSRRAPLAAPITGDTLTGTVAIVGSDPATWVTLRPAAGGPSLRVEGAEALRSVSGAEVFARGARDARSMRVEQFQVRRVNGAPVFDGMVVLSGDKVALRHDGFTRLIENAPPGLRELVGKRAWVSHPVAGVAPSYGLIAPE